MKVTGMLVVSLRDVINCRCWSRLGFLGKKPIFLPIQVSLRVCVKKYLYEKAKRRQSLAYLKSLKLSYVVVCFSMVSFRGQITPEPRPDWSPLGV